MYKIYRVILKNRQQSTITYGERKRLYQAVILARKNGATGGLIKCVNGYFLVLRYDDIFMLEKL